MAKRPGGVKGRGEDTRGGSEHLPPTLTPSSRGAQGSRHLTCIPDIFSGASGEQISREGRVTWYHETWAGGKRTAENCTTAARGTASPCARAGLGWEGCLQRGFWPAQLSFAKEAPKAIPRCHTQQESPGWSGNGKRKSSTRNKKTSPSQLLGTAPPQQDLQREKEEK